MEEGRLQFFKFWKPEDVERIFDVSIDRNSAALAAWLATDVVFSDKRKSGT